MISARVVLAGACAGAGIALVVAGTLPGAPDLRSALTHLDGVGRSYNDEPADEGRASPGPGWGLADRIGEWIAKPLMSRLVEVVRLARLRSDLTLLGETPESLAVRKVGYLLLGLAFPPVLVSAMGILGLRLPWAIPGFASIALAAALFVVPDLDLRRRAGSARAQLRRATCAYLELVALERAADAGTTEALQRAATVATSPGFVRIQEALLRAQLSGQPQWQGLNDLATSSGVVELGDVADIMRLSGQDGAAVYTTLRARAASLRSSLLAESSATANAASEHMIVPVAFLGLAFMALVGYPAFARIMFGT